MKVSKADFTHQHVNPCAVLMSVEVYCMELPCYCITTGYYYYQDKRTGRMRHLPPEANTQISSRTELT